MKYGKILRPLGIAIVLSLLMVAIPAEPALAAPVIDLSPASGAVGTRVTITGTNFGSYIGDGLRIFFNNVEITDSPKTVPVTGSFEAYFDVPDDAAPGTAWVTIRGPISTVVAKSPFNIPQTRINLDVTEGTVGTRISITGRGFYADKIVAFYYHFNGVRDKLGSAMATPVGECSFDFTIPSSTVGKKKISAENGQGDFAEARLEVITSATLDITSGGVGDIVNVSGTGFGDRSEVAVYFRTNKVAYADADRYGSFEGAFKVPEIKAGTYDVKIEDEDGNIVRLQFTIAADAKLDKTEGSVGTELTISGTGFKASDTVSVKYDNVTIATTASDSDGTFSVDFDAPVSGRGEHLVTVSDSANTRQFAFTVESEAPPVPALIMPETDTEVEPPVSFQWQEVSDPSLPIGYNLQVTSDEDFTDVLLEKQGLPAHEYTLSEEEKLKPTRKGFPYYWRVQAVDSASNESEWSTAGSFYIASGAFLPTWVIIALIVFGVAIIIFVIWRLRRETSDNWEA